MKTLHKIQNKVLQYKVAILVVAVVAILVITSNVFAVGYYSKYWKTNREAYTEQVINGSQLSSKMVATMYYLMLQDQAGKKDIYNVVSRKDITKLYLEGVNQEVKDKDSSLIFQGCLETEDWITSTPHLCYYMRNNTTGNVITNANQLGEIEDGGISETVFENFDLLYKLYVKGPDCTSTILRGNNGEFGNKLMETYENGYADEYSSLTKMHMGWTRKLYSRLDEKPGYTFYIGVKNISVIGFEDIDVDEEYVLFGLGWFYILEFVIILVGSLIVAFYRNIRELKYAPFELSAVGILLVCVVLPDIVIIKGFSYFDQSQCIFASLALVPALMGSVYASNIVGQMRRNGWKQELATKSYIGRKYAEHKESRKHLLKTEKEQLKHVSLQVIIKGIILTIVSIILWYTGVYFKYKYGTISVTVYRLLFVIYLLALWLIWVRRARKKALARQRCYQAIVRKAREMAEGQLDNEITEDVGEFYELGEVLNHINEGLKKAVEEAVTSQSMKTELITNVSHDLKTPLTSIVSYVDLLKRTDLTDQEKMEFIEILEQKSGRLKTLIEDLFEMSKAASKDIKLTVAELNIVSLTKEVLVEYEQALDEKNLKVNLSFISENIKVNLDGQKTYRIIANLVGNIVKYTMPHTRVYVTITKDEEHVILEFKNISATEITHQGRELIERFVREDASRNTEGSGLGLAIAKSLTELQNGTLEVEADGDLFKATVTFPLATE